MPPRVPAAPWPRDKNLPAKQVCEPLGTFPAGTGHPDLWLLGGDVPGAQPHGGKGGGVQ